MESFSVLRNENAAETICTTIVIRRLRTVMITAKTIDGRLLVAAGNEYGFDEIFAREVAAFGAPGDVLICLTTSGKSKNVRRAGRSESVPTENDRPLGCDGGINHRIGGRDRKST